ncbi:MAG TPA: rhamnulokinase family protein [Bryobacteraceae bacterium]|jgi:rhamnulokinase|nr:rhamnulokinase family protein [Bryobacteraceae bacterium]
MSHQYLAIDLGAESGRAMLADLSGHQLKLQEVHRFPNCTVNLPTGLYWDTLRLFYEMLEGLRAAAKLTARLGSVAIDTWGVDFGLIGVHGALIDNPRHYRDPRTVGLPEKLFEIVPRADVFAATGIQFMELNSLYQLWAVHRETPWLLSQAQALLFMPDLFNYFLSGTMAAERTIASTSQFYDPARGRFATELLEKLGIATGFLPGLVDPGVRLGSIRTALAESYGVPGGTPVYTTASHDTASAVAAVPADGRSPWCYISSGTWSLMGMELDRPLINDASLAANFTNEAGVGGSIRFLKNIPGLWLLQECRRAWAREGKEYSYDELIAMARETEPSGAVLELEAFQAAGQSAERVMEYCRTTGQPVPGTPGAVCRVILYSLAVRYREVLGALEEMTGRRVETIHIVGGGSRNRLLNQLTADVTGRRVVAGPSEATAAGNALVQALGAGQLGSLEELRQVVRESFPVEEFVPKGVTTSPVRD